MPTYRIAGFYYDNNQLFTTIVEAPSIDRAIRAVVKQLDADAENVCIVSVCDGDHAELNTATHVCSVAGWPKED